MGATADWKWRRKRSKRLEPKMAPVRPRSPVGPMTSPHHALNPLLRFWPAEGDEKRAPGDRLAERRGDPERQTGFDRPLGVVDEAAALIGVALEMGKGDPRLAEYRTVPLHRQHDRQSRAGGPKRLAGDAGAELALKVHECIGRRGAAGPRGASTRARPIVRVLIAGVEIVQRLLRRFARFGDRRR